MKFNSRAVWVFVGCLAVVVTTHAELLGKYPEWVKDILTLVSLAVIGVNRSVTDSSDNSDSSGDSQ